MAVITVLSAKGSPGVTTATIALTMAWSGVHPGRSAVVIDADPIGGDSAAGVLRGAAPAQAGMLSLATSRGLDPIQALDAASVHLRADGSARLVPGVPDLDRAPALILAWDALADLRTGGADLAIDLFVDAGRADRLGDDSPWLQERDLALLLVRPTLPAVTAAHRLVARWPGPTDGMYAVVVDAPSPYSAGEVADAVGLGLAGTLAFDDLAARVHSQGAAPGRAFERSEYVRSVRRLAGTLGTLITDADSPLASDSDASEACA
ncbi:MAG: hypothetical protein WCF36_04835 [Candidatus Nanopelagicales bacterium]